jgi:hypothetical protein
MKGTVKFYLTTKGKFNFDIDNSIIKDMTPDEFREWLWKVYINECDYKTLHEQIDYGTIEFEDGEVVDW